MKTKKEAIVYIDIECIHPNPENPRKAEITEESITELADNIKENGLMQNLMVFEDKTYGDGHYTLLIGHRRYAACKKAGLTKLPCTIRNDYTDAEKLAIMLSENMQRSNLTTTEEAFGFQRMLDFGADVNQIATQTGYSTKTVKHRLNIAKLDKKTLEEKQNSSSFQLSLTDLYSLERVDDIEERNRILKECGSAKEIAAKVEKYLSGKKKAAQLKKLTDIFDELGIKKIPKSATTYSSEWKWKTSIYYMNTETEEDMKRVIGNVAANTYYKEETYNDSVTLYIRDVEYRKREDQKKLEEKERKANNEKLQNIVTMLARGRKEFVRLLISGKIPYVKESMETKEKLWKLFRTASTYSYSNHDYLAKRYMFDKSPYELSEDETKEGIAFFESLTMEMQMVVYVEALTHKYTLYEINNKASINREIFFGFLDILKSYGFSLSKNEVEFLNGNTSAISLDEETDGTENIAS